MKKFMLIIALILPLLFVSCMTSQSYFKKGYYDMAIQKSAKKLMKNPNKTKHISIVHKSYNIANAKDYDRIAFLRSSGQPDVWDEIFDLYNRLKRRQEMVKYLPESILQQMNFQNINYDNEIHQARQNAAEYFYANGVRFLNENSRNSARLAYYEFLKVKSYYENFRDTDKLLRESEERGTVNVLYQVKNATNLIMPEGFAYELTQISLYDMNVLFRRFFNKAEQGVEYQYSVTLYIDEILVSPEQIKEVHYSESKEIQDGFQYLLDQNGNVVKDSLGNDVKVPKYVKVTCDVIEVQQFKSVAVISTITIRNEKQEVLIHEPLSGEWVFDNRYITWRGDQRAMTDETRNKLGWQPLPFPVSEFMILQTTDVLKNMSKDFVYKHRNLFN